MSVCALAIAIVLLHCLELCAARLPGPFRAFIMVDAAGLFGSAAADDGTKAGERRTKLRRWDHVATQALNPVGASPVKDCSLKELWDKTKAGGKATMFFSNLAAGADSGGLWRVGVGASQTAESLLAAIAELRRPIMKQLIIKVAYEKALAAAAALEPHLKILNAGKGSETGPPERAGFGSLRSAAAAAPEAARPSQSQVETAAAALYDFLVAEQNPLRAVLALLSGGGSFYAAAVAEKTARAWVKHAPATREDAQRAAVARAFGGAGQQDAQVEPGPDDTVGLF